MLKGIALEISKLPCGKRVYTFHCLLPIDVDKHYDRQYVVFSKKEAVDIIRKLDLEKYIFDSDMENF